MGQGYCKLEVIRLGQSAKVSFSSSHFERRTVPQVEGIGFCVAI